MCRGDATDRVERAPEGGGACRCRWIGRAAVVWATLFAAPHVWWAFGISTGFPGGSAGLAGALAVPWFVAYDLLVVTLCGAAAMVALAAMRPLPVGVSVAWGICGILLARGIARLVVDGLTDLVWSPMFVAGGLLFGATAWLCRHSASTAGHGWDSVGHPDETRTE